MFAVADGLHCSSHIYVSGARITLSLAIQDADQCSDRAESPSIVIKRIRRRVRSRIPAALGNRLVYLISVGTVSTAQGAVRRQKADSWIDSLLRIDASLVCSWWG